MEMTCSKVGARSISEFARVAARRWMDEAKVDHMGVLFEKLARFEQALDELQAKVRTYQVEALEPPAMHSLGDYVGAGRSGEDCSNKEHPKNDRIKGNADRLELEGSDTNLSNGIGSGGSW